jgi:hypothetical protein
LGASGTLATQGLVARPAKNIWQVAQSPLPTNKQTNKKPKENRNIKNTQSQAFATLHCIMFPRKDSATQVHYFFTHFLQE